MKKVLVQGVLGLQEMVQLDSGLLVPVEVAEKKLEKDLCGEILTLLATPKNTQTVPPLAN